MGINITATKKDGGIVVKMINNFANGQLPPNPTYFLFAHSRGKVLFTHEFNLEENETSYELSTKNFPTGIIHLSLFNMNSEVVSERLIFVNNNDFLKVNLEPSKTVAETRENITLKTKIVDKNNNPII
jgi:hypothetical protein